MITYLKVNGVDQLDKIDGASLVITRSIENTTCQMTVKQRFGTTLSWLNGQTVILKLDDDTILLYGKIRSITKSDDLAQITFTVQVDDLKLWYQTVPVKEKFRKYILLQYQYCKNGRR